MLRTIGYFELPRFTYQGPSRGQRSMSFGPTLVFTTRGQYKRRRGRTHGTSVSSPPALYATRTNTPKQPCNAKQFRGFPLLYWASTDNEIQGCCTVRDCIEANIIIRLTIRAYTVPFRRVNSNSYWPFLASFRAYIGRTYSSR